jgi:hypothetical protein
MLKVLLLVTGAFVAGIDSLIGENLSMSQCPKDSNNPV